MTVSVRSQVIKPRPQSAPEQPASVAVPGLVFEWMIEMRTRYAGDATALAVVDGGLAELKRLCSRVTGKRWIADADLAGGAS